MLTIITPSKTVIGGKIVKEFENGYVNVEWKNTHFGAYRPQIEKLYQSDEFMKMVKNTVFADIEL